MTKKISAILCAALIALSVAGCKGIAPSGDSSASSAASQADGSNQPGDTSGGSTDRPEVKPVKYDGSVSEVAPDRSSGFYGSEFDLTLTTAEPDCYIYYTTDGSDPDMNSELYTGAIHIRNRSADANVLASKKDISASNDYIPGNIVRKGTVIKAAAFKADGSRGDIFCGTYFVGIDREKHYADVPIISIVTDEDNLFDYETGIYVLGKRHDEWLAEDKNNKKLDGWQHQGNYSLRGKEWERPANVEIIEADGTIGFSQVLGVRIKGGASRNDSQKSLKFTAREEFGKKNVKYTLIPGNERSDGTGIVDKYKSFALRNGGNDNLNAKIRDPLLQDLVADRDFETMQHRPCVAFINGEYWGLYTIIEDYTDNYFENNYPIESDNVVLVKRGEIEDGREEDIELYNNMLEFINGSDMSDPENYKKASEMLDMQSFADYCAFELYIHNEDSLFKNDNNWRMWRARTPVEGCEETDGKWRMVVYDVDYSLGIYGAGANSSFLPQAMSGKGFEDDQIAKMVSSLCANDEFRKLFANSLLDTRNINFDRKHVKEAIAEISPIYIKLTTETASRFGPDYVRMPKFIDNKIDEVQSFLLKRFDSFANIVQKNLDLGELHRVILRTGEGTVRVNTTMTESGKEYYTSYLSECPITLTAVAPEGKKFVRWDTVDLTLPDPTAETIEFAATADCEINAVFE
ncbi:MAG: CotH kinase family protein [Ruminococcus sp.]|nr:CotH kinase family protein [Ruminococcus sp.]